MSRKDIGTHDATFHTTAGYNLNHYKVRQQLVDMVLLTLFLPLRDPDKIGFGSPNQSSKSPQVEFSL